MKKNIFDSKSELRVYRHLESMWSEHVKIFDHVPVTNVVSYYELQKRTTYKEFDHLLKSNFDFVIGSIEEKNYGEPILIIEFDGIGKGYNSEKGYNPKVKVDPDRQTKLNLKLKVCEMAKIPMIIVSYPEVEKGERDLTILDGIIGQVLAKRGFEHIFHQKLEEKEEELERLVTFDPIERQALVEWCGAQAESERESESDWDYNSLVRKNIEMEWDSLRGIASIIHGGGYGDYIEEDGYLVYQSYVKLDKDYRHLLHEGMEIYDGTEEFVEGESGFEWQPKAFARGAKGILIRKKIKIRAIHCESVYIAKLAKDLIHYLILSDLTERWNLFNTPPSEH